MSEQSDDDVKVLVRKSLVIEFIELADLYSRSSFAEGDFPEMYRAGRAVQELCLELLDDVTAGEKS